MRGNGVVAVLMLAACGGGGGGNGDDVVTDGTPMPDSALPVGCARPAAAADRARHVVVSRPYDTSGGQAPTFEVLDLSDTGTLTRPSPNNIFSLGRAVTGTIAFTPDGSIGLVAEEDGKLGVFSLDAAGVVTPIETAFAGAFYAGRVVVEGDRVFVVDPNTIENGGGVYLVTLDCDGKPTDHGLIAGANTPNGIAFTGERSLIAASKFLDSPAGDDAHLGASDFSSRIAGANAFPDDMEIVGGTALSADGKTFLIGDVSQFSNAPNRVAAVTIDGDTLTAAGAVDVEDPEAIAVSPFGDVAVVASAFGDALFVLEATAGTWSKRGEVNYSGGKPMLPGDLTMISGGTLNGRVLVSENVSVRQLQFAADGSVTDVDSLAFGNGLQNISGAIGVTP